MSDPETPNSIPPAKPVGIQNHTAASGDELEWREYLFFREEMRHSDSLINQRVSWLISSQAFLLGGFATLINSGGSAIAPAMSSLKGAMIKGLPIAGILAVFAGYTTILAAVTHVLGIRQLSANRSFRGMPSLRHWHTVQLHMGLFGPLLTPLIFIAFWIVILAKIV